MINEYLAPLTMFCNVIVDPATEVSVIVFPLVKSAILPAKLGARLAICPETRNLTMLLGVSEPIVTLPVVGDEEAFMDKAPLLIAFAV